MLNSWHLDFSDGDFTLVFAPPLLLHQEVRAYHLELLNQVRALPYFEAPSSDKILFSHYRSHYEKIAAYFNIDVKSLESKSRHEFFISNTVSGDYSISGLEQLMGYSIKAAVSNSEITITSGVAELDITAELLLHVPRTAMHVAKQFSLSQSLLIVKQISDRNNSAEVLKELQRKKDLEAFENKNIQSMLKKSGFSFPG